MVDQRRVIGLVRVCIAVGVTGNTRPDGSRAVRIEIIAFDQLELALTNDTPPLELPDPISEA